MIIGFDAKRATANFTGLGNYSRYIIDSLACQCPEHSLRMYIPKIYDNAAYDKLLTHSNVISCKPDTRRGLIAPALWRIGGINSQLKRDSIDIFHGLSNEIPFGIERSGIASVVTIHDLIFLRYPKFYKPIDRVIYNTKFHYACNHARRIIAVSDCTKRDIVKFYNINPDKIDVIHQNCHPIFSQKLPLHDVNRVKMAYNLPDKFMLYVGTIETRKNALLAIKALPHIDPSMHMIIIGRKTPYINELYSYINNNKLNNRVRFIHDMDLTDLPAMYHMARIFVFPSRYEGFGIPILEALTSGTPVIAATGSCLEEAGGPSSIYIDPDDTKGMIDAINAILTNESLRYRMKNDGLSYIQRFDNTQMVQSLLNTYDKARNQ
ncbi:MAG: glycosyltransferase family 4 protein [Bacteroidaceae bacterium]|nr:glycosyltransferase family 4 protein [Bacteroidaceae bacterium]